MKVLSWVLICLCVFTCLFPLREYADDENIFNFSTIKRAVEGVDDYQAPFLNDITRLGLVSEALTALLSEGKKVSIEYATKNEWNHGGLDYVIDGYMTFRLWIRTDATDEYWVYYPTSYRIGVDTWEDYERYVTGIYRPIEAFVQIYNEYLEPDNNWFDDIVLSVGLIGSAIFAIIYLLVVFLFDSISMLWGLIVCFLRLLGLAPLPT